MICTTARFSAALAACAFLTSNVMATSLNFDVRPATPGGSQQIYELNNGNYLGLWGISGGATAQVGSPFTSAQLTEDFGVGSANIVGYYYNTPNGGAWAGTPADFTPFGATAEIAAVSSSGSGGKLFDSFWVEWTGGNLFNLAQNSHMPASKTLSGDPLIPEPGTLTLLASCLLAAGLRRRR